MQRVGNFYSPCLPGKPRKATRKFSTSRGDGIFFGACPKSDKMSVVSTFAGEKDRVCIIPRRARNIFAEYIAEYNPVVVLYKYEKILL